MYTQYSGYQYSENADKHIANRDLHGIHHPRLGDAWSSANCVFSPYHFAPVFIGQAVVPHQPGYKWQDVNSRDRRTSQFQPAHFYNPNGDAYAAEWQKYSTYMWTQMFHSVYSGLCIGREADTSDSCISHLKSVDKSELLGVFAEVYKRCHSPQFEFLVDCLQNVPKRINTAIVQTLHNIQVDNEDHKMRVALCILDKYFEITTNALHGSDLYTGDHTEGLNTLLAASTALEKDHTAPRERGSGRKRKMSRGMSATGAAAAVCYAPVGHTTVHAPTPSACTPALNSPMSIPPCGSHSAYRIEQYGGSDAGSASVSTTAAAAQRDNCQQRMNAANTQGHVSVSLSAAATPRIAATSAQTDAPAHTESTAASARQDSSSPDEEGGNDTEFSEDSSSPTKSNDAHRYMMKNFEYQGEWVLTHDCGANHATMKTATCAVCRKENAKLANYPLQPIERCSTSCVATFDAMRQEPDKRPPKVAAFLMDMQRLKPGFKKKPSFDGKGGKMYITLKDMSHAYALIQRTRCGEHTWRYRYYYHSNVVDVERSTSPQTNTASTLPTNFAAVPGADRTTTVHQTPQTIDNHDSKLTNSPITTGNTQPPPMASPLSIEDVSRASASGKTGRGTAVSPMRDRALSGGAGRVVVPAHPYHPYHGSPKPAIDITKPRTQHPLGTGERQYHHEQVVFGAGTPEAACDAATLLRKRKRSEVSDRGNA